MRAIPWLFLLLVVGTRADDPTSRYTDRQIEGWTVRVHQKLLADTALADPTLKLLQHQLYQITLVVPAHPLAELKKIAIWVEAEDSRFPCCCYHEDVGWLKEHGVNPDKVKGVEIANPKNFLAWIHDQPWMILHELAHGYHHRVLGGDFAEINARYAAMMKSDQYTAVKHINGGTVPHYARTNAKEYFAESTEAFFGTNDFYPFTRAELRDYDPEMFHLLEKIWGDAPSSKTHSERKK